jgi:pyrimidine deaminase RibD-like protein
VLNFPRPEKTPQVPEAIVKAPPADVIYSVKNEKAAANGNGVKPKQQQQQQQQQQSQEGEQQPQQLQRRLKPRLSDVVQQSLEHEEQLKGDNFS